MRIYSTYSVKIKHYNRIFNDTVKVYRKAVDFLISVCLNEWNDICVIEGEMYQKQYVERMCHRTASNPEPKYKEFNCLFYKFPSYLRRSAISEAMGKAASYRSSLKNWSDNGKRGKEPSFPKSGRIFPCMYKTVMYEPVDDYKAKVKVFIRNTWDWLFIDLKKSDADYITKHCGERKQCAPTLMKRGKQWFLDFPFEEQVSLNDTDIYDQTVIAVDMGLNCAATVTVMRHDGTILGRRFLRLPAETDRLYHSINRIKKAQQHGNRKMPRLWAKAGGINDDIAVKTADFIMETAVMYKADTIVFEYLELNGKKRGGKKQLLHHWKCRYVQSMVKDKAHRKGMRVSHVNAWNTSKLAYDGSGTVERGIGGNCSVCRFQNGKIYNCDLSASYNIGSRYFIREILKSLPVRVRLVAEAKVPQTTKRSTCTLSVLISLNAELSQLMV